MKTAFATFCAYKHRFSFARLWLRSVLALRPVTEAGTSVTVEESNPSPIGSGFGLCWLGFPDREAPDPAKYPNELIPTQNLTFNFREIRRSRNSLFPPHRRTPGNQATHLPAAISVKRGVKSCTERARILYDVRVRKFLSKSFEEELGSLKEFCIVALTAAAEGSALDAFQQLTGQDVSGGQTPMTFKTNEQYLDEVMIAASSSLYCRPLASSKISAP